jgi:branched-chain amino acid transport system substrate-binding protein
MKRKWSKSLAVITVLALALAACSPSDEGGDTTEAPATTEATATTEAMTETTEAMTETTEAMAAVSCDEPVKVGMVTDETGSLAVYGSMMDLSVPLGFEYATGAPGEDGVYMLDDCPIELIVKDDQSDPEVTGTVARELVEVEGVDILIGTVSSGATATLQEVAADTETPLIVAPAASSDITGAFFNEYTFRTSRQSYQDAMTLCAFFAKQHDTFVAIAQDYTFGQAGAAALTDACTNEGATFVQDPILVPLDVTEFTPYMEQVLDSGAEAWVLTWAGATFIQLFQAAADTGVLDEMALGAQFIDNNTQPVVYGNAVGQTGAILYHYTLPDNPINDWLVDKAAETDAGYPDLFWADGMNAAIAVVEALKATGGDASADALLGVLEGLQFDGPKGTIYFRPEDHVAIQDMYVVTLDNVDDPEFKYYTLQETVRPEPPCQLPDAMVDRCGDLPVGTLGG